MKYAAGFVVGVLLTLLVIAVLFAVTTVHYKSTLFSQQILVKRIPAKVVLKPKDLK